MTMLLFSKLTKFQRTAILYYFVLFYSFIPLLLKKQKQNKTHQITGNLEADYK